MGSCCVGPMRAPLTRQERAHKPFRPKPHLQRCTSHGLSIGGVRVIPPLTVDCHEATGTGHHQVIDIAILEGDAVHPPPNESLSPSCLEFAPCVFLAPRATQVKDRLAVVGRKAESTVQENDAMIAAWRTPSTYHFQEESGTNHRIRTVSNTSSCGPTDRQRQQSPITANPRPEPGAQFPSRKRVVASDHRDPVPAAGLMPSKRQGAPLARARPCRARSGSDGTPPLREIPRTPGARRQALREGHGHRQVWRRRTPDACSLC